MTKSPRSIDLRELSHDRLGPDRFAAAMSDYDTQRRVQVLVDQFLVPRQLAGRELLDVGCGLGAFSRRAQEMGAHVTACDLGPSLVQATQTHVGCRAVQADVLRLGETFPDNSFDMVLSSECIEHTPDPGQAILKMCRVLKPGGLLSLSTPNRMWYPVVRLATLLRLRPFDGLENFSSFRSLQRSLSEGGLTVIERRGVHLFPFQLRMHPLSMWLDQHAQPLQGLMINLCVLAQKEA